MKELTEKEYKKYMTALKHVITETEWRMKSLPKQKKMVEMSFEEWKEFQLNQRILK